MTPHGVTRYKAYGCRCDECRVAATAAARERRAKVRVLPVPDYAPHGSPSTYRNYGCRCDECRAGKAADLASYRIRKAGQ